MPLKLGYRLLNLSKLKIAPGIDKQNTEYGAEGRWIDCDNVRFRYGKAEKIGGWEKFFGQVKASDPSQSAKFVGRITNMISWVSNSGSPFIIIGTSKKLYAYNGGNWGDITPLRSVNGSFRGWGAGLWNRQSFAGQTTAFSTTNGSNVVTVHVSNHGILIGDFITLSELTGDPGGIANANLEGEFEVQDVTGINTFTIIARANATSTQSIPVGAANITFQINVGTDVGSVDYGWNVGSWNEGSWNTARSVSANVIEPRVWQFDLYGEDVICNLIGDRLYLFNTSSGINSRATEITDAPAATEFFIMAPTSRQLICLGTDSTVGDSATQNKMLLRFSDIEGLNTTTSSTFDAITNTSTFTEKVENFAGAIRLTDGSKIMTAVKSRNQLIVLTDTAAYGLQFVGGTQVFASQQLGANCGCVAPLAAVEAGGITYWMSKDSFYMFDGTVKKLPCTVEDFIFDNLNFTQSHKFHVGLNSKFNEITWWYTTTNSDYIDRMVTYNYLEGIWSVGSLSRTAWVDYGSFENPIGAEFLPTDSSDTLTDIQSLSNGRSVLYTHEKGVNNENQPITAFIQSGYLDIADGNSVSFVRKFVPDFKNQQGNLNIQLLTRVYPNAQAKVSVTDLHDISPTTEKVDTRARGRQVSLKIQSQSVDTTWRIGDNRILIQPDGLR